MELEAADVVLLDQALRLLDAGGAAVRIDADERQQTSRRSGRASRISSLVTGPPQRTESTMKQTAAMLRSR